MSLPTRKEALAKIEKEFVKMKQMFSEVVTQKFEDVTLQDGSTIQVDTLAVNGNVTANGLPVSDGSYTLQNGTIITVTAGVITSIAPQEGSTEDNTQDVAELPDVDVDMSTPEKMKAAVQKMDGATPAQQQAVNLALIDFFTSLLAQNEQVTAALSALKATQTATAATMGQVSETMAQTFAIVKEIGEEPIKDVLKIVEPMTAFQKFQANKRP